MQEKKGKKYTNLDSHGKLIFLLEYSEFFVSKYTRGSEIKDLAKLVRGNLSMCCSCCINRSDVRAIVCLELNCIITRLAVSHTSFYSSALLTHNCMKFYTCLYFAGIENWDLLGLLVFSSIVVRTFVGESIFVYAETVRWMSV